jgi:hypothetical protein
MGFFEKLDSNYIYYITELNNLLDAFIAKYADKFTLEDWLDGNQFEDAVADERDEEWMGR